MARYYRPLCQTGSPATPQARRIAGAWAWFDHVEVLERGEPSRVIPVEDMPRGALEQLSLPRAAHAGLSMDRPRIMGILNVTPDSFSDGGRFDAPEVAVARAKALTAAGQHILDIGGESTRPGAPEVPVAEEIARTAPVIAALRRAGHKGPISIDTRKAAVAEAAIAAGADLVNDVSGFDFDPAMADLVARTGVAVCLMHAQGTPETMQANPAYDDVLLDVYDALAERVARAEMAGIHTARISVDPGIGFGKTEAHNIALIRGLSLFHGLGCPVLLGVSRKRFIGRLGGGDGGEATGRMAGTVAITLEGLRQGVQMHRVHDVAEVTQALRLWQHIQGEAEA
ncbi:dihydropteroate synthase [Frigidibacter sp. MR17.14]|uniref:dihydropteroate synthase n=1 Tax=Frigidibacter sp. MR17.14 TaxID=3126509 RepID=UPI003012C3B8